MALAPPPAGNPALDRLEFPPGKVVVVADSKRFSFPQKGYNGATPPAAPAAVIIDASKSVVELGTHIDGRFDQLLAALKAGVGGQGGAPPVEAGTTPTPPSGTSSWFPATLPAGQDLLVPPGTFTGCLHTGIPLTIKGAGMRKTILDGQRGIGGGHRLAWGKGILHMGAPTVVEGVGFVNGGGGDERSDGEAGAYLEAFEGTATIRLCAFDNCENAIFAQHGENGKMDLVIDRCVFGRVTGNGIEDERSHDLYVNCKSITIKGSIFCDKTRGNRYKTRAPNGLIEDSFVMRAAGGGRWIDMPGGTDMISRRNTYVTLEGTDGQNAFGIYDENDGNANPGKFGSFHSTDDTWIFSRWKEVFWVAHPESVVSFTNPKVFWVGAAGSNPPSVEIMGPGKITGVNPFGPGAFTEANRLDRTPEIPVDPT